MTPLLLARDKGEPYDAALFDTRYQHAKAVERMRDLPHGGPKRDRGQGTAGDHVADGTDMHGFLQ